MQKNKNRYDCFGLIESSRERERERERESLGMSTENDSDFRGSG